MEILNIFLAILPSIFLGIWVWKILNWAWFKPRKLEKCLRDLGLRGTSYKFLFGDVKEIRMMDKEAASKPMNVTNDIIPRIAPFINKTIKEYGENCYIWTGPNPTLMLMDPDLIKEVFNKTDNFLKLPYNPLVKLLAEGLVNYNKEKWAKHRKLINPAFKLERVKLMMPAFHACCFEMLSKWEEISGASESFELDMWPYLETLTSDAISRTAFGSNFERGREIFELQKEQTKLAFQAARSVYIPGWRFIPSRRNRRMKEIANLVESLVMDMINSRLKMVKDGESPNGDLLDVLLESNSREIEEKGDKKFGMSLRDVVEECKLFYFAGHETASSLLVWTLVLLSKHPDWQSRAREEVRQVIEDKLKPHFDDFNHLKVITMIINEVLRLYPPATIHARVTEEETKLGTLILPSGVIVYLPGIFLQHDTKIWGEDANEFKPERFIEGVLKATKGQLTYFPFGWGPRICPGQNFSMLEVKMALAMMLQNYTFELSPSYTHAPVDEILLQPQHGALLILHKLSNSK